MAFGTAFAMKPPVVKAKMGKKVVSAMYVAIRRKIWYWWARKNKKVSLRTCTFRRIHIWRPEKSIIELWDTDVS